MNEKSANFVAVVLSSYAKRILESRYDDLFKTELAARAKQLDPTTKYAIEAGLYAALAYGDQKFPGDKPWKKFLFEVVKDAPSEISKRLINGVKKEGATDAAAQGDQDDAVALRRVLSLDDESLAILMRWGAEATEADFARIVAKTSEFSPAEFARLDLLPPSQRRSILGVSAPPATPEQPTNG